MSPPPRTLSSTTPRKLSPCQFPALPATGVQQIIKLLLIFCRFPCSVSRSDRCRTVGYSASELVKCHRISELVLHRIDRCRLCQFRQRLGACDKSRISLPLRGVLGLGPLRSLLVYDSCFPCAGHLFCDLTLGPQFAQFLECLSPQLHVLAVVSEDHLPAFRRSRACIPLCFRFVAILCATCREALIVWPRGAG